MKVLKEINMGIFYGSQFYGIRCRRQNNEKDNDEITFIFELQFRSFGEVEKAKVKELIKTELKEVDPASSDCTFQLFRPYSSTLNINSFCTNQDEARSFMWVNTEFSVIEKLLLF